MNPKVTVIMPVYNAEKFVGEAIESILNQTFADFELIIIDDGSEDRSREMVAAYVDPRLRFYRNEKNIGAAATMNRGIDMARGAYIARMDADDISLPARLAKQVAFLDQHPGVGVVGSWVKVIGDTKEYVWKYETQSDRVKIRTLFQCSIAFPTAMMRKDLFEKYKLRLDEHFLRAEDFKLWAEASHLFPITNIGEVLLYYRVSSGQLSRKYDSHNDKWIFEIFQRQLSKFHISPTDRELYLHKMVSDMNAPLTHDFLFDIEGWMKKLCRANDKYHVYESREFKKIIGFYWYALLVRAVHKGIDVFDIYRKSTIRAGIPFEKRATFRIKYLLRLYYAVRST